MSSEGYNGWSNYETWAAGLWLSNDEAEYRACCATVEDAGSVAAGATQLKEYIEVCLDSNEAYTRPGLFTDLLQHALAVIDWYELAEHFKPDNWSGDTAPEE